MKSRINAVIMLTISITLMFAAISWGIAEKVKLNKQPPFLTKSEKDEIQFLKDQMNSIQPQINLIQGRAKNLKDQIDGEHPGYQYDLQSGDFIPIPKVVPPVKK